MSIERDRKQWTGVFLEKEERRAGTWLRGYKHIVGRHNPVAPGGYEALFVWDVLANTFGGPVFSDSVSLEERKLYPITKKQFDDSTVGREERKAARTDYETRRWTWLPERLAPLLPSDSEIKAEDIEKIIREYAEEGKRSYGFGVMNSIYQSYQNDQLWWMSHKPVSAIFFDWWTRWSCAAPIRLPLQIIVGVITVVVYLAFVLTVGLICSPCIIGVGSCRRGAKNQMGMDIDNAGENCDVEGFQAFLDRENERIWHLIGLEVSAGVYKTQPTFSYCIYQRVSETEFQAELHDICLPIAVLYLKLARKPKVERASKARRTKKQHKKSGPKPNKHSTIGTSQKMEQDDQTAGITGVSSSARQGSQRSEREKNSGSKVSKTRRAKSAEMELQEHTIVEM